MMDIIELSSKGISDVVSIIKKRSNTLNVRKSVEEIIENVKSSGDKALRGYTLDFDKVYLESFKIEKEEIEKAYNEGDLEFIEILKESIKNIEKYHQNQKKTSYIYQKELGVFMGQRLIPMDSVAIYVPGGKAAYPSSVLMNAIPAKVAGVNEIVLVTPPDKNGKVNKQILVAAKLCGINKVYKLGGAQAIAALAYGTESIENVSMIVGPGNAFVAEAKRQVYGDVGIDMVAGPSEILIVADEKANPKYIAADLMSQAEHDELASSILVTTSKKLADKVNKEIEVQVKNLSRRNIIESSLINFGKIVICKSIEECIELANLIAPEHLELLIDSPIEYLEQVKNAGSVFLGEYTPEPIGDYFGGTNHVLPTGGTARFSSPLSVDTFVKKSSFLYYSQKAVVRDGEKIIRFANEEGLTAHANSVKVRLDNEEDK
ncbi:MAG: histidinol dehydrogenase [Clostridium sp.]|uniref:histidinol dehydrogenase n=1 Tax=Clostridium cuniculi TaxID=2548455 RepID=UPI0011DC9890|nr:histidinol dehydrogenase [Clostridium cuniculi]MBQ8999425.1 histidinol dehydrogenase [Clostridium sp.]